MESIKPSSPIMAEGSRSLVPNYPVIPKLVVLKLVVLQLLGTITVSGGEKNFTRADFPADFVFGAGTSAYQVEGAAFEDGRLPSIWDTFAHSDAGLEAYRFSISWSRLIPNGRGPVNPKGLQYYNNLINELIKHGIQPHVTLFHLDTPQVIEDEYGGWVSRKIVRDFTNYADVCFKEFGDRVSHWTTLNEPNVFALGGYDNGLIPPRRCSAPFGSFCTKGNSSTEPYLAGHNLLLAHSSAAKLYNRKYKPIQHGFVGLNFYAPWFSPYTNASEDVTATQRAIDFYIGWLLHPLVFGDYPDIIKKNAGTRLPVLTEHASKLVKGSFDFIGLNHYFTVYIKDDPSSFEMNIRDMTADMAVRLIWEAPDAPSDKNEVDSSGLFGLLEYLKTAYGNPPIYVHENGVRTVRNGTLHDIQRVKYIHSYIGTMLDALRNGSNTKGYFLWSLLDGFELFDGYRKGYGLYYVDLDDRQLRRYPKLSAHWYSSFIKGRIVMSADDAKIIALENENLVPPISKASQ